MQKGKKENVEFSCLFVFLTRDKLQIHGTPSECRPVLHLFCSLSKIYPFFVKHVFPDLTRFDSSAVHDRVHGPRDGTEWRFPNLYFISPLCFRVFSFLFYW